MLNLLKKTFKWYCNRMEMTYGKVIQAGFTPCM